MAAARQATARKPRTGDVVDIQQVPVNPDLALVDQDRNVLQEFLGGLTRFFSRARELEVKAKTTLTTARTLQAPKNGDDDARIQTFIRQATAGRKEVEEHWTITAIVHGLHRKLTAARARATGPYEEAAELAQRLHNRYVEDEKRRAREEADRLQREAEQRAREEREAEVARLEAEAVKAEEASADLSERERIFVDDWMVQPATARLEVHAEQTAAGCARRAGFKDYVAQGKRLLRSPKILAAIAAKMSAETVRQQAAAIRELPLDVEVAPVRADVAKVGTDRTTWSADVFDARMFVEAVVGGRHGIPIDCLMPNPVKLNEYARSMHELIDRWPGVRAKKSTRTI